MQPTSWCNGPRKCSAADHCVGAVFGYASFPPRVNATLVFVTHNPPCYTVIMVIGFKHKGLERFFRRGSRAGVQAKHADRLRLILGRLHASTCPQDMNLPGLGFHPLPGDRQGYWAVKVSGNWRVIFRFLGKDADALDYEDYH